MLPGVQTTSVYGRCLQESLDIRKMQRTELLQMTSRESLNYCKILLANQDPSVMCCLRETKSHLTESQHWHRGIKKRERDLRKLLKVSMYWYREVLFYNTQEGRWDEAPSGEIKVVPLNTIPWDFLCLKSVPWRRVDNQVNEHSCLYDCVRHGFLTPSSLQDICRWNSHAACVYE